MALKPGVALSLKQRWWPPYMLSTQESRTVGKQSWCILSIQPFTLDSLIHFYYTASSNLIGFIRLLLSLFKESMHLIIQTAYHRGHLPCCTWLMSDVLYFM